MASKKVKKAVTWGPVYFKLPKDSLAYFQFELMTGYNVRGICKIWLSELFRGVELLDRLQEVFPQPKFDKADSIFYRYKLHGDHQSRSYRLDLQVAPARGMERVDIEIYLYEAKE